MYSAHNFLCLLHYGLLQPAQLLDVLAVQRYAVSKWQKDQIRMNEYEERYM